jgi:hypothetical protein
VGVPEGAGRAASRAACRSEARRREAERARVEVTEYTDEIGWGRLMMRKGGMKNYLDKILAPLTLTLSTGGGRGERRKKLLARAVKISGGHG